MTSTPSKAGRGRDASPLARVGFTLIEVMLVVVVVGLLMMLATMGIASFTRRATLSNAVQEFVSTLHMARVQAIRNNASIKVTRTGTSTYTVGTTSKFIEGATFTSASADSVRFASFGISTVGTRDFYLVYRDDTTRVTVNAAGYTYVR